MSTLVRKNASVQGVVGGWVGGCVSGWGWRKAELEENKMTASMLEPKAIVRRAEIMSTAVKPNI